uniref:Uncharacterized protein n=1 Tax=Tanacetum cinerariifolium TaxID=118510 RepID=A0A699QB56_TANCI|nr:hypothetical protein [Tanacetum cinerariifolium]
MGTEVGGVLSGSNVGGATLRGDSSVSVSMGSLKGSDSRIVNNEEDEEIDESLDYDSVSEDAEEEGHIVEDEDLSTRDEGLAAGVEGPGTDDQRHGMMMRVMVYTTRVIV